MGLQTTVYVLGAGAIGFPLAAFLAHAGRRVVAVRTSRADLPHTHVALSVRTGSEQIEAVVETAPLAGLARLDGILVVAAKAFANPAIAQALHDKGARGPVVLLQNGVGVERPFLDLQFSAVYRCVLYFTAQALGEHSFATRPVMASPIGVVRGSAEERDHCVAALSTEAFPFRSEAQIEGEVWRKAITNAAFNTICPLLEVDNGIFARDAAVAALARGVVQECVALTDRLGLGLSEDAIMEQLLLISRRSDGQLISTLQDLRGGRPTEIAFLNQAIAEIGAALQPPVQLPQVELLGRLIGLKSALAMASR